MPKLKIVTPQPCSEPPKVRVPQLRVLRALDDGTDDPPALVRQVICERAGFSPISGTINSCMNGVPDGSSSVQGRAGRPGLIELGMVAKEMMNVDGAEELAFRITPLGRAALAAQLAELGELPEPRDKTTSTNRRYKGE